MPSLVQDPSLILAFAVVTAASATQATLGIGLGIVAAPILLLIEPRFVPSPLLIANSVLALLTLLRDRQDLRFREVVVPLVGRLPGSAAGALLVTLLAATTLDVVFGALLVFSVILSTLRDARVAPSRSNLFLAGCASGLTGTAVGVGGPPIALVYRALSTERLRATMAGYFVVAANVSLVLLWAFGDLRLPELLDGLFLSLAAVLGYLLSMPLIGRVAGTSARTAVLLLSGTASLWVLLRGLVRLLS